MNLFQTVIKADSFGLFFVLAEHVGGVISALKIFPVKNNIVQEESGLGIEDLEELKKRLESVLSGFS